MGPGTRDGRPAVRTTASRLLLAAAALLTVFAWGLGEVVEEARGYAVVHGGAADTSQDQVTQVVALVVAGGLLLGAALVRGGSRRRAGGRARG